MIKYNGTFTNKIIRRAAKALGYEIVMHTTDKSSGYIMLPNGRRNFFFTGDLGLNSDAATSTADQKYLAEYWLEHFGYQTIPGEAFALRNFDNKEHMLETVRSYIKKFREYPVIIKPCNASQGKGVSKVHNDGQLVVALDRARVFDSACMVQEYVSGIDYRILVFNNIVYFAYQRLPLNVVGDGSSTVSQLLEEKKNMLIEITQKKSISIDNEVIQEKLESEGLSFETVPPKDKRVILLDNANLSTGGEVIDVTHKLHDTYKELAVGIARDMNMVFCGVDFILQGNPEVYDERYKVIEVNAHPGVREFTRRSGIDEKHVEQLYSDILEHLAQ